jgi:F0F1-type ATP synthase assembly protein I
MAAMKDPKSLHTFAAVGSIGFVVAGGVVLGWLAGSWADRRWGWEPWGTLAGVLLGLAGAAMECWVILKKTIDSGNRNDAAKRS